MEKECLVCGGQFIKKINESKKYWATKKYCSKVCADKIQLWVKGRSPWNKGKKYPQIAGSKNPAWKGGITPENEKVRKSRLYKIWQKAIFEMDDYTCQKCGTRGGYLNAHHILPFATHVEIRFALDNGKTLCRPCHLKIDHNKLLIPINY